MAWISGKVYSYFNIYPNIIADSPATALHSKNIISAYKFKKYWHENWKKFPGNQEHAVKFRQNIAQNFRLIQMEWRLPCMSRLT